MFEVKRINLEQEQDRVLFEHCYTDIFVEYAKMKDVTTIKSLQDMLNQGKELGDRYLVLVALAGDIPCGLLIGDKVTDNASVLEYLVVSKEYRRQGVASLLLEYFWTVVKTDYIFAETDKEAADEVNAFWEKQGAEILNIKYIQPALRMGYESNKSLELRCVSVELLTEYILREFLEAYFAIAFNSTWEHKQWVLAEIQYLS